MRKIVITLAFLVGITTPVLAQAPLDAGPAVVIQPMEAGSGSGSAVAVTPTASTPAPAPAVLTPQAEDISVLTKLWKNGAFFAMGIIAVYVGLVAWSKLDKKHAFYAATGAAGLAVLVEAIRKGDAPTATAVFATLTTTVGVMIAGPGHVPAGK